MLKRSRSDSRSTGLAARHSATAVPAASSRSLTVAALLTMALGVGCVSDPEGSGMEALERAEPVTYENDDLLRLNQLQSKGTHNSYHMMSLPIPPWHYTHLPFDQQLETQGVRALEMDVHLDG